MKDHKKPSLVLYAGKQMEPLYGRLQPNTFYLGADTARPSIEELPTHWLYVARIVVVYLYYHVS